MKIKGATLGKLNRLAGGSRLAKAKGERSSGAGKSAKSSASPQEDVKLSPGARILGSANEAIQDAPDIRMERVTPIREALAAGRYSVANLDVADKILRQVLMEGKRSL